MDIDNKYKISFRLIPRIRKIKTIRYDINIKSKL